VDYYVKKVDSEYRTEFLMESGAVYQKPDEKGGGEYLNMKGDEEMCVCSTNLFTLKGWKMQEQHCFKSGKGGRPCHATSGVP